MGAVGRLQGAVAAQQIQVARLQAQHAALLRLKAKMERDRVTMLAQVVASRNVIPSTGGSSAAGEGLVQSTMITTPALTLSSSPSLVEQELRPVDAVDGEDGTNDQANPISDQGTAVLLSSSLEDLTLNSVVCDLVNTETPPVPVVNKGNKAVVGTTTDDEERDADDGEQGGETNKTLHHDGGAQGDFGPEKKNEKGNDDEECCVSESSSAEDEEEEDGVAQQEPLLHRGSPIV